MFNNSRETVRRIKEIRRKSFISLAENEELTILEKKLSTLRNECSHSYHVILLFNKHHRYCTWCDVEDLSYIHQD